ncbi:MAG: PAS domain S-box protein, partial [Acidobacteriota bacterium]|nr:PAS domain S-box protein [Acidobacteriota bacterium]
MSVSARPRVPDDGEVQRLRILNQLLAALSQASELPDVYEAALTSLLEATAADRAEILLFDDDGMLRCKASRGVSGEFAQPVVVVPFTLNTGVIGKFMLYYDEPHECGADELDLAQTIAAHVALATQHKRAEGARALSEQRLQGILDNLASVIFLKDPQGRYLLVNRCFEQLFQVKRTDVLGRTDRDIFPADTADRFQASDRAVLAAGQPLEIEEDIPHDGGGMHSYSSLKFPLEGPDGSVAGVGGISTDITERKQLEAASRRLAAIVESSDDAIIGKDLHGIITSWNKATERTFGYSAEEAIGQPVSMLAPLDHIDEMPDILSKIKQGQRVEHYETRRQSKEGEIIDVSLTVSPVRDAAGRIVGASKIARDISNRKQAEQERARLLSGEQEARRTAELLNRVGPQLAAQLDLQKLVQQVTDSATTLVGAEMGAYFQNVANEQGESYMLYTLSGVLREAFAGFTMPGNT